MPRFKTAEFRVMNIFKIDRQPRGFSYWVASIMIATMASVLPAFAITKASKAIDPRYIATYLLIISMITVYSYWSDKRKAKDDSWRTPESTLHLLELAGGWIAGFFSQRLFRHKISKKDYQFVFWTIAVIHQYVSFDFMNGWRYTQSAYDFIKSILE